MFLKWKNVFYLLLAALFLISLSCEGTGGTIPKAASDTADPLKAVPASEVETNQTIETTRRVVLVRGNEWVHGVPGFGANSFPAYKGEYRLLPRAVDETGDSESEDFLVYLTTESLYFSEEWQPWPLNSYALQHSSENALLIAVMVDDGRGSYWIAVFEFPMGLKETGLGADTFNRLIQVWTSKFLYFLSLSKTIVDVSLPAIVEF